jgi:hypothetical protein
MRSAISSHLFRFVATNHSNITVGLYKQNFKHIKKSLTIIGVKYITKILEIGVIGILVSPF